MHWKGSAVLGAFLLMLSGCDDSGSIDSDEEYRVEDYRSEESSSAADGLMLDGERGSETYEEYGLRRDSYGGSRGSFMGDECTVDCSGHEAGYAWASDKGITNPDDCGGNSWSFIEGCRAYAEEQQ